jgi:hypothetical protein
MHASVTVLVIELGSARCSLLLVQRDRSSAVLR